MKQTNVPCVVCQAWFLRVHAVQEAASSACMVVSRYSRHVRHACNAVGNDGSDSKLHGGNGLPKDSINASPACQQSRELRVGRSVGWPTLLYCCRLTHGAHKRLSCAYTLRCPHNPTYHCCVYPKCPPCSILCMLFQSSCCLLSR